jgi:outer membrane protein
MKPFHVFLRISIMGREMRNTAVRTLCAAVLIIPVFLAKASAQEGSPLSFDEASKLLLLNNPQALAAARSMDAARSRVTYNKAGLGPQVSANAAYNRLGTEPDPSTESYAYGFSASQPLFSPALPAAVRSARAAYRKAEADYDRVRSNLLLELKTVFSDLIKAREVLKLSEETLKRRAENVEIIRIKYEAGRENKAALLETQAVYTTSKWQHESYNKDLRLLERKLNRLLARPAAEKTAVAELEEPPAPPEDFESFAKTLELHPSLRSTRASLDSARAAVDRSVSGFLPEASANGKYTWSGTNWPDKTKSWSAGASLSLPLFASGKLLADLASSKAGRASAEAALKDSRDEVFINAEDAFLAWRQARAYTDVVKTSLEAANARAWLLRKQYLAGQASYFEWRNVEDQLISSENQLLQAKRDLMVSHAAFINSLGE